MDLPTRSALPKFSIAFLFFIASLALLAPAPFSIISPGPTTDVMRKAITITGTPTSKVNGQLFATAVYVTTPDARIRGINVLSAWLDGATSVMPRSVIYPPGATVQEVSDQGKSEMSSSIDNALSASMRFLKISFTYRAVVSEIAKQSNTYGVLKVGDRIMSINGLPITSETQLGRILSNRKVGEEISLTYSRAGKISTIRTSMIRSPEDSNKVVVGIRLQFTPQLPFHVGVKLADTGGPSAGLVFSIGIVDLLSERDYLKGRKIGATGEIDSSGKVLPIGGVDDKVIAAHRTGAKLFLIPVANCVNLRVHFPELQVVPVNSLSQALGFLEQDLGSLPRCP